MRKKSFFGKKKILLFILTSLLLVIILGPFFILKKCLPDEFYIMKGKEHIFEFNMPLRASIETGDTQVLNINDELVKENVDIDLAQAFSVRSENDGAISVKLSLFGVIPLKTIKVDVISDMYAVPCGNTIGVRINTDGIMVLGTGNVTTEDETEYKPAEGILKPGDLIQSANGTELLNKEHLIKIVNSSNGEMVNLIIKRDGELINANIKPIQCKIDDEYKIGVWVRDSTQGIGTITYYNPQTREFGALGHGIQDVDTGNIMSVRDGYISSAIITSITKGKKGVPGELVGNIIEDEVIGEIAVNTPYGVYGKINSKISTSLPTEAIPIGLQQEVHEGNAKILSNIIGNEIREYDIYIQTVNKYSEDEAKGMIIRITDETLLSYTNGIVQGMSGSPIIQDGKLIGAVTHVFIQSPNKGYGIFIENMMLTSKTE